MAVIITLGENISWGGTVSYDRVKHIDLGKRNHVLKHLHGRMILGPFERFFHEGFLWRGYRAVISFMISKQFLCIFIMGIGFITEI